jgi:hypothetical protein
MVKKSVLRQIRDAGRALFFCHLGMKYLVKLFALAWIDKNPMRWRYNIGPLRADC